MKRLFLVVLLIFISTSNVEASDKFEVTLDKCVDGDTAWFYRNNEKIKARFLAIDTPESTTKIEEYGKEASNYTCNELTNANTIEIEYDDNSDEEDKYHRKLVWVFVDGKLLQNKIIENGWAEVKYLYGDYKYTALLENSLEVAKKDKVGMWSDTKNDNTEYYLSIGIVIILLIVYLFSSKIRKKINTKAKRKIKNKIDDLF